LAQEHAETAAFYFTSLPDSYAARTGRPDNVGVIGVALFRKKQERPQPYSPALGAPAPESRRDRAAESTAADAKLGTGHGRREASYVQNVDFERASSRPAETIALYYDSYRQPGSPRRDQGLGSKAFPGFRSGPERLNCHAMGEATDEELMLAYRGGDAAAFETLYSRHRARLFRFVLRSVKTRALAEELYQETWMRVIEARSRYTPKARFTTWLYTIAHNQLVDHWRKRGLTLVALEGDELPGNSPDPAQQVAGAADARAIRGGAGGAAGAAARGIPLARGGRALGGRDRRGDLVRPGSGQEPAALCDGEAQGCGER
jgi:hypothetical protein